MVQTTYMSSNCASSSFIAATYTPNPADCQSSSASCAPSGAGYTTTECSSSSCPEFPSGKDTSLSLAMYATGDCSGAPISSRGYTPCELDMEKGITSHTIQSGAYVWGIDYDSTTYCDTKVGDVVSWGKAKPGCYKLGDHSSMKIAASAAMRAGVAAASVVLLLLAGVLCAM